MNTATAQPAATSFRQRLFRARPEDILPLDIQHQRIYILPTKRGLTFTFSLLIMLIASINYALSLGYALCFLLTGLFAASLLHTYRNVANLTCEKIASDNIFAGGQAQFSISIKNKTTLERVGVTLKSKTATDVIDVGSGQTSQALLTIPTKTRGKLKLGRITITSSYPLGLWRTWCYLHSDASMFVYPAPEPSAPPIPSITTDANGETVQRAAQGDISGVREYNPGDAISSIAWKAASRGQGLFVKTFDEENAGGEVHINLAATGLQDTEQQLSRLCAWVLAAEKMQTDYSVDIEDTQLTPGRGATQKHKALLALAQYGSST